MPRTMFDVLKDFSTDLQSQSGLPDIEMRDPPTDSASMRFKINNPDETPIALASALRQLTGEINVQVSHARGTSEFTMQKLAGDIVKIYQRPYKFGTTTVLSSRSSSVYSSEAHEHINVIISFMDISM